MNDTDARLTRLAASGDRVARSQFMLRVLPGVRRVATRLLWRDPELEDVVQQACVVLLRSVGDYRGDAPLLAWVRRVVAGTVVDHMRASAIRHRRIEIRDDAEDAAIALGPSADERLCPSILRYLERIPKPQSTAMVLHFVWGYSAAEVAELTGASKHTVRSRLYYGSQRMRALIRRDRVLDA